MWGARAAEPLQPTGKAALSAQQDANKHRVWSRMATAYWSSVHDRTPMDPCEAVFIHHARSARTRTFAAASCPSSCAGSRTHRSPRSNRFPPFTPLPSEGRESPGRPDSALAAAAPARRPHESMLARRVAPRHARIVVRMSRFGVFRGAWDDRSPAALRRRPVRLGPSFIPFVEYSLPRAMASLGFIQDSGVFGAVTLLTM